VNYLQLIEHDGKPLGREEIAAAFSQAEDQLEAHAAFERWKGWTIII
jgi:hypothetical protein